MLYKDNTDMQQLPYASLMTNVVSSMQNVWHELKEYQRREVKPKTKQELVDGINGFWNTVNIAKCTKYIRHLRKVLPKVIELQGAATGY